jgi:hypothetical protein
MGAGEAQACCRAWGGLGISATARISLDVLAFQIRQRCGKGDLLWIFFLGWRRLCDFPVRLQIIKQNWEQEEAKLIPVCHCLLWDFWSQGRDLKGSPFLCQPSILQGPLPSSLLRRKLPKNKSPVRHATCSLERWSPPQISTIKRERERESRSCGVADWNSWMKVTHSRRGRKQENVPHL